MKVENIKHGEMVARVKKDGKRMSKTFIRGEYNRSEKCYELQNYDDINDYVYVKKGTELMLVDY
ncbi:hypothetical protein [Aquimarina algiphila]|uniref:Uncharacterized protein n=1 Tax=Aquimarina algiphila TaxID=2047982 RepID=A0A554VRN5_9FLAO|nr:hypothetical protein [Aquimarina algiphila]TSE11323.1 hypothetical protein FOF46_01450 [Aquimarina algiphila]